MALPLSDVCHGREVAIHESNRQLNERARQEKGNQVVEEQQQQQQQQQVEQDPDELPAHDKMKSALGLPQPKQPTHGLLRRVNQI